MSADLQCRDGIQGAIGKRPEREREERERGRKERTSTVHGMQLLVELHLLKASLSSGLLQGADFGPSMFQIDLQQLVGSILQ
jgi:hypothetical protein